MVESKKALLNTDTYKTDKYYEDWDLKLDSNENPYGASSAVINVIKNFDFSKIGFYPAYGKLLDKLADLTGADCDNFILTNGCDEAINVVLNTFLDKEDEVLSFSPTFSMPAIYSKCAGAKFVEIPYKEKWIFDYETYIKNIGDKTKIIYLTSPNNPTGDIIPPLTVRNLLNNFKDKLVVLDCTYINYSSIQKEEYYKLADEFENLVTVKSFSKDYALAGLRLGYIYSNKKNIKEIKKVISPYSVNSMALYAGLAALEDISYFENIKIKIKESKEKLVSGIKEAGFKAYNTEANFILAEFEKKSDFIYQKLLNNKIKVKYFQKGLMAGFFRITAPKSEDVGKIIEILKPKPLFIFDLDGVIFDVQNSYRLAIKNTFKYFTKKECSDEEIQAVKNLGNMSNDWDVTAFLIKNKGINVSYKEVVEVFQNLFFNPLNSGSKGLIDNEELVFKKEFFEELTKTADCAVFTGRPQNEAFYSLEKYGIKKYFSYFICNEDVENNHKPSPYGLNKIKNACLYTDIFYFGDTVDDIKAGIDAGIKVYGIIPPNAKCVNETKEKLKSAGANEIFEEPCDIIEKFLKKDVVCK